MRSADAWRVTGLWRSVMGFCWIAVDRRRQGLPGRTISVTLHSLWEPRDMWVGLYWTPSRGGGWIFYLCLLPCFPLVLRIVKDWRHE